MSKEKERDSLELKEQSRNGISLDVNDIGSFPFEPDQLSSLVDPKDIDGYGKLGGLNGLSQGLDINPTRGISTSEKEKALRQFFGRNLIPHPAPSNFLWFLWEAYQDKTLLFLTAAAFVSLSIGIYSDIRDGTRSGWIEGVAILVAVVLVVVVNAVNDYQKDRQFRKLSAKNEDRQLRAVRNGEKVQLSIYDACVGDVILLDPGDVIPADGVLIEGHGLCCDESGATGESDTIKKDPFKDPFLISVAKVLDGSGSMLIIAVGAHSYNGRMLMAMQIAPSLTPLQAKLDILAERIAKYGFAAALTMFVTLLTKYCVINAIYGSWPPAKDIFADLTTILIQAITVVVVAVPEGLPMAVTLALAFATTRMLQDNNLVRILSACETMGNATTICSDKTGTLTENKMTVVKGQILASAHIEQEKPETFDNLLEKTSSIAVNLVEESIAINSSAFAAIDQDSKRVTFIGSKTEAALLGLLSRLNYNYSEARKAAQVVRLYPFASERKVMSTIIKTRKPNGTLCYRIHTKGASEIVLGMCDYFMRADGIVMELTSADREDFWKSIESYAKDALRTLSIAFRDFSEDEFERFNLESPPSTSLTLLAILGIEDPVRSGVPQAVADCQKAGIFVRMVTGDNEITARSIAQKCGILMRGGIVMEGPEFRRLTPEALDEVVPRLQVLARSSPMDKQILVRKLRSMGEVVAVTGDGTNDGPAMRAANVGFAMGIAGTEVAKEASSIILMDDNFASIVKAVIWGRCVNDAVRKFLQFQLTVNVAAVVVAFVSAVMDKNDHSVLSAVQLLWVNLIMDSFAALALATDKPTPDLLDRHPEPFDVPLITTRMRRMIGAQASFQIIVILLLVNFGPAIFSLETGSKGTELGTFIFNTFVFLQLFNEINCRRLDQGLNVFKGIFQNRIFLGIWLGTVVSQCLIVFFGGVAFSTVPIGWQLWGASIGLGILSLPLGAVIRLIPKRTPSTEDASQSRVYLSRERLQWQAAAENVRRSLSVFAALRRAHRLP